MVLEKVHLEGGHVLLKVVGVIKLGESARFFAQALENVFSEESGHVLLDLSGIDGIDSTGIGELVGYLGRFGEVHRRLILIRPSERIVKLLEVAQLRSLFPIFDSVEEALAAQPTQS
jgi:anti-sigma B factor antagonist